MSTDVTIHRVTGIAIEKKQFKTGNGYNSYINIHIMNDYSKVPIEITLFIDENKEIKGIDNLVPTEYDQYDLY